MSYAREFAERYIAAEAAMNPHLIAELYAPEGVLRRAEGEVVGRDALRDFYASFLEPMAEIRFQLSRAFGDGEGVAFEWTGHTRMHDGSWTYAAGCDVVSLSSGLITLNSPYVGELREHVEPPSN